MQSVMVAGVLLGATSFNASADQSAAAGSEKTCTGQVVSVAPKERMLTVESWMLSKKQFNLGDNCAFVMLDNHNGSMADLRVGEKVTLRYQLSHGVRIADRIEQQPLRFAGVVTAIDPVKHTLTLHRRGLDKELEIAAGCSVVLKNNNSGTLSDVQLGDHVTVTYETPGGMPTARQIAQTSAEFTGKVAAIDLDERMVRAKDTFSTMKFNLADDCTIVINGKTNGKLSELRPNERLVFDYDSVNGVNVVNRIAPAEAQPNSMATSTSSNPGYPGGF